MKQALGFCSDSIGGMFGFYFSKEIPASFEEVKAANQERFKTILSPDVGGWCVFSTKYVLNWLCLY